MLGAMALTLLLGMAITGFSIAPFSVLQATGIVGAYTGYAYYKRYRAQNRDPLVIFILGSTGQILLIPVLMTPLTYVAGAVNLPLQDVALNAADRALGLDWMAYFNFVYHHHVLLIVAVWTYSMIGWPVFGVPIVLGWTGRYRRLQTFTLAFGIALVVDHRHFCVCAGAWARIISSIICRTRKYSRPAAISNSCATCRSYVTARCAICH